jgi:hypothetical protein
MVRPSAWTAFTRTFTERSATASCAR